MGYCKNLSVWWRADGVSVNSRQATVHVTGRKQKQVKPAENLLQRWPPAAAWTVPPFCSSHQIKLPSSVQLCFMSRLNIMPLYSLITSSILIICQIYIVGGAGRPPETVELQVSLTGFSLLLRNFHFQLRLQSPSGSSKPTKDHLQFPLVVVKWWVIQGCCYFCCFTCAHACSCTFLQ